LGEAALHAKGVSVISQTGYCDPECEFVKERNELIGRYSEICDAEPVLHIDTVYHNVTVQRQDAYELHFTLWGGGQDRLARNVHGTIMLPTDVNGVDVYFRPYGSYVDFNVENNYVTYNSRNVKGPFEIIIAYGRGASDGAEGRKYFRNNQIAYENTVRASIDRANNFTLVAMCLILLAPLLIFIKLGREPDTNKVEFSREPPSDLKPYQVNFLSMGQTGNITPEAVSATILDLGRRGHIIIEEVKGNDGKPKKDVYMTFAQHEREKLTKPEQMIYNFFHIIGRSIGSSSIPFMSPQASSLATAIVIGLVLLFVGLPMLIFFSIAIGTNTNAFVGFIFFFAVSAFVGYRISKMEWNFSSDSSSGSEGENKIKWSDMERSLSTHSSLGMEFRQLEKALQKEISNEMEYQIILTIQDIFSQ
jgi:hypothetical protein